MGSSYRNLPRDRCSSRDQPAGSARHSASDREVQRLAVPAGCGMSELARPSRAVDLPCYRRLGRRRVQVEGRELSIGRAARVMSMMGALLGIQLYRRTARSEGGGGGGCPLFHPHRAFTGREVKGAGTCARGSKPPPWPGGIASRSGGGRGGQLSYVSICFAETRFPEIP